MGFYFSINDSVNVSINSINIKIITNIVNQEKQIFVVCKMHIYLVIEQPVLS